jgi:hypothetical protein
MDISVSLFTSPSKEGLALESQLRNNISYYLDSALKKANQLTDNRFSDLAINPVLINIRQCASDLEFSKAQLENDIVIFDGSLEDDGLKLGDNYSCTGHAPYLMDNVLVVSRTVLPINYIPNESNVPPVGEEERITDHLGRRILKKNHTNEEICNWLTDIFCQWIITGRLPRKIEYKRNLPPIEVLFNGKNDKKSVQLFVKELSDISEKTNGRPKNRYEHTAFISYRSYYAENKSNRYSVEDLKRYILDYHKVLNPDENWTVLYYSQGTLAQDCMTEFRRWGLMTYVDNIFKHVPEVWIFNTNDTQYGPSYWDSWFTQSEFVSLIMLHQELPEFCPRIIEFYTSTGIHREIRVNELPEIKGENKYYLDIITANSEILYGDYSGLVGMQFIKEKMKEMSQDERKLLLKKLSKQFGFDAEKAFKSRSYDSSFMSIRIVSCKFCLSKGNSFDSFTDPDFIQNFTNIGSDDTKERKNIARRGYFSLNESEFNAALEVGIVKCPNCGNEFLLEGTNDCIYIWRHKFNNPAIDFDGYIEKVTLYHITEKNSQAHSG